jgi:hypothetical protein
MFSIMKWFLLLTEMFFGFVSLFWCRNWYCFGFAKKGIRCFGFRIDAKDNPAILIRLLWSLCFAMCS